MASTLLTICFESAVPALRFGSAILIGNCARLAIVTCGNDVLKSANIVRQKKSVRRELMIPKR